MASGDTFKITVNGVGGIASLHSFVVNSSIRACIHSSCTGHGAVPDISTDAIVATGHLITQLQTIVSRNVSPLEPAVLTIGTVNGGKKNLH